MASEGAVDADGTLVHGASAADGLDSSPSVPPPGFTIGNAAVDKIDQQQQQRETGGGSINPPSQRTPASSSGGNIFVANQAALSITLVVGSFFLVINILLLAAVYQHRSRSARSRDNCNATNVTITSRNDGGVAEVVQGASAAAAVSCESVTDLRRYHQHHQPTTLIPLQTLPTPTRQLSTSDSLVLLGSCQTLTSDVMTASSSANTLTAAAAPANVNVRALVQQQQHHHNESPPYLMRSPPPPPLCFQMSDTGTGEREIVHGHPTNTIGRNKINGAVPVPVPMPPPAAAAKSTHEITV